MAQRNLHFDHRPVRIEGRLLLESICLRCAESRVVSVPDGTLAQWEEGHVCSVPKRPSEKSSTGVESCPRRLSNN